MVGTQHYLLLGAGFSHNWGGWLASEVFEYLLGDEEVIANDNLRTLLWSHHERGGFEGALDELRRSGGTTSSGYLALHKAVRRMFDTMNSSYPLNSLEFRATMANDIPVRDFLHRFHAIFTLNQDLLLERCYRGSRDGYVDQHDLRTERDWYFPGMKLVPKLDNQISFPTAVGIWMPSGKLALETDGQPIYKLHGSSNWRSSNSEDMMIVGGGKAESIEREPVLTWYSQMFADLLGEPGARLMIIGYGFRDEHINECLVRSIKRGLQIFVIDPAGADAGSAANPLPKDALGYRLTQMQESLRKALIGASRRRLASTFRDDNVERRKIERFFGI
jgi:hypothetical protein